MNDEVHWPEMWRTFGRIGILSFGGPAAQIALMHRELVDEKRWLEEQDYLRALSFCMLLPGPEAMQLATYAGWRLKGVAGGLLAGLLFVLPGALVILALAAAYVQWGHLDGVQALFIGVKACVAVIVVEALLRVARRALKGAVHRWIAILAFVGLFFFGLPFPLIILLAALVGMMALPAAPPPALASQPDAGHGHLPATLGIGLALWGAPLLALWLAGQSFLLTLGLFFSKLALVTFGGAYAVLAYMTQAVVQDLGWLETGQMIDALGLAETTPGPLILVTEFVAYVAGHGQGSAGLALAAVALTLWVTFVPCFLWIFAFAPYIDRIARRPRLQAALAGITAAVVGVIGSLSLWFALHVLFARVAERSVGPLTLPWPDLASLSLPSLAIMAIAGVLLLLRHWRLFPVLGLSAALGVAAHAIPGVV